ncbi:anhydro-N-acetylmuramic acid kinase [Candidatus Korobacter versatilis]|nr:anhydro-N-acetylmuramic acid kinase [Candidatus Koribacter versatilis]
MSGTSADGINVALVQCVGRGLKTRVKLIAHEEYPYPSVVRHAVLAMMNAAAASVADLARLNFVLGELYADAVLATLKKHNSRCDLIGCHGQTLYHQGEAKSFLGRKVAVTWQTGESAILAARTGVPVVSDFRPADMAAGGKGAPLVPYLDILLFGRPRLGRIVQNIGGIGNMTAIPAGAKHSQVVAFDTGPGNMVIDAVMQQLYSRPYDKDGAIAAEGTPDLEVARAVLRRPFFRRKPPKTAGREEFGREFVAHFIELCGSIPKQDIVATATVVTAMSIRRAIENFLDKPHTYREILVSGGGAKNPTLLRMLGEELENLKVKVRTTAEFGMPIEAKEAVAFAVMAYQTWRRQPSNVPSATGASRPAILGKITYA